MSSDDGDRTVDDVEVAASPLADLYRFRFGGSGASGLDFYNCSAPWLTNDGQLRLLVRTERREDEFSSVIRIAERRRGIWSLVPDAPAEASDLVRHSATEVLQDPAIALVHGQLVVTVVRVHPGGGYSSQLYAGPDEHHLQFVVESQPLVKGFRVCELEGGRVGVFTRPQSPDDLAKGGRGKIGFFVVEDLSQLTLPRLAAAPLLPLFGDEEWGGANDVQLLSDGRLAVLGHRARFEENADQVRDADRYSRPRGVPAFDATKGHRYREYRPFFFVLDPKDRTISHEQWLGDRDGLSPLHLPIKRLDLRKVEYPSFMIDAGTRLWVGEGVSDASTVAWTVPSPLPAGTRLRPATGRDVLSAWQRPGVAAALRTPTVRSLLHAHPKLPTKDGATR